MKHYDFAPQFRAHHDHAVRRYQAGARSAADLFDAAQLAWVTAHGLRAQDFFDYAEDLANYGEPTLETALMIEALRRDYFLQVQHGRPSTVVLEEATMPAKQAAVRGIEWLPRILPKAKAKLRGELPESLMYGCGGDRRFFLAHDIQPAEFLGVVWRHENDDAAIIAWVIARSHAARS